MKEDLNRFKSTMRFHMLVKRNQTDKSILKAQSESIIKQIKEDPNYQKAHYVGIYYPIKDEVNLLPLLKEPKKFAFPRVDPDGIHFYEYGETTSFTKSKLGVPEPHLGLRCDKKIEYMLVPALAISTLGHRIGYGKAYYDHYLTFDRPEHVYGVIYDFQEISDFGYDEHDVRLDGYFKGTL